MKKTILILAAIAYFTVGTNPSISQEINSEKEPHRNKALKVYMEANDYIKVEIPFVNYVREIADAQLFIMSTSISTGSGGREYTFSFFGQKEFSGMNDTLILATNSDDTQEIIRQKQVRALKMGLMRYVFHTPYSKYIDIGFKYSEDAESIDDKWNNWIFSVVLNGNLSSQKSYKAGKILTNIQANQVKEENKTRISVVLIREESRYELETGTLNNLNTSKFAFFNHVWSLNDHWSLGGYFQLNSQTYTNDKLRTFLGPACEYNIFPYSESTRRQLRILYETGYEFRNYVDTTIYNKLRDNLGFQKLDINYHFVQKWGSSLIGIHWRNYLHDFSLNSLSVNGVMNFRIMKGLSANLTCSAAIIHDQINLAKMGATPEEIIMQKKELATQYRTDLRMGFTYTFGSIFNNIVNPRFGF
jgi:hypothetical protein